jgi:DNA-binding CsgD family transcriptional regulator/PAS domain-containing protein
MKLLQVFICHRQADGAIWARCLHGVLHGRSVLVRQRGIDVLETLAVYLDEQAHPIRDWKDVQGRALEEAEAFLAVCSPGARSEFTERPDWLYLEIRWWLKHHEAIAPILITPLGADWIPQVIRAAWPNAPRINVPDAPSPGFLATSGECVATRLIETISRGATHLREHRDIDNGPASAVAMATPSELYMWEKDRHFRYTNCNENYARIAGYDSPAAMIGKTDDDMPWRTLADYFRRGDHGIITSSASRKHVTEHEITVDGVMDILVSENRVLDRSGECVGVTGYFVDITGFQLVPRNSMSAPEQQLALGEPFGHESLTEAECSVLKHLLDSQPHAEIARHLGMSRGAVDSCLQAIKRKLQCDTDGDVIATVMRSGLPLSLFGPSRVR